MAGLLADVKGSLPMPRPDRGDALDHVVVLMFENRSFDNLLGRLYQPGEVASFEGVAGRELSNPVPGWAEHRLKDRFATHFVTTGQFLQDAASGELPAYSFIEPCLLHGHNDMHPPENALFPGFALDLPSSLLGGEALLAKIYNAVRSSSSPAGSNVYNTLLMICFDEHGGTYDHVPPPAVPSPDPSGPPGQYGFTFDRSGTPSRQGGPLTGARADTACTTPATTSWPVTRVQ
jgi:phospholipase C